MRCIHQYIHFWKSLWEVCNINTDVPDVINVALIMDPKEFEYEAPIAVRYCFENLFPEGLDETLKRFTSFNDGIDLHSCNDHSVNGANNYEHSILPPAVIKDNTDGDYCAVPLMLLLLKHYRDIRILDDKLPVPSDTSIDADLTRIKYYTQLIVDQKATGLSISTSFNDIWNCVSEAITRLGDVQMRQHCANLKKAKIGEINKDKMLSLIEVQKKIIMLQKNKDELTERLPELKYPLSDIIQGKIGVVEEWNEEDKMFVETRSSDLLLKHSLDRNIKSITVVGGFGIGKTCTTRHIALLLRQQGYRVLPVSTYAEIKNLDDEDIPTLFIVDDFCGSITSSVQNAHAISKCGRR
ncbi:unnamed protein product [Mytilus edulis]|uniref:DZIP3-like HEPN domain-containing protein n=1 Tax=Mytilus edulis TaxID=6550 RepID=A0A8S3TEQ7_MYTED|nr:unnamed protein product [Mytilus edulis]